mgnify:FL=1|tara:strand:+ start:297 stop:1148 length:852 start_codon:yes stop_codon:yes gene_type:complete
MLNIFYRTSHLQGRMSGPLKVIQNLCQSLEDCGVKYATNTEEYKHNFFLHWDPYQVEVYKTIKNKESLLVGPQMWPFAPEFKQLTEYGKVVAPSWWVKDKLEKYFNVTKCLTWPVAIYKPETYHSVIQNDCLIYHKNRTQEDLEYIKLLLSRRRLTYTQLQYGSYTQDDFKKALASVRFCVIIDNTESQGIAIQEMMMAHKPLFVWDTPVWDHMGQEYAVPASSVPYWDSMCGEKVSNKNEIESHLDTFLGKLYSYTPAKYVNKTLSPKATVKILTDHFAEYE